MDFNSVRDWTIFGAGILVWAFGLGVLWTRITSKIDEIVRDRKQDAARMQDELGDKAERSDLNGLGGRLTQVESNYSAVGGRMDRFEKELSEYRGDARAASDRLSRLEKGVEAVNETVREGNTAIGVQLHAIEKLIEAKDKNTSIRLTRIETVQGIEKKLGPLPED